MPGFRKSASRPPAGRVCHRIVLPKRTAGFVPPATPSSRGHAARELRAPSLDLARMEKELVERAMERIRAERAAGHRDDAEYRRQVEILERRLEKLATLVEQRDRELMRLKRQQPGVDTGIPSIYDSVQGLEGDDEASKAKKGMMTKLFEANLQLQKGDSDTRAAN